MSPSSARSGGELLTSILGDDITHTGPAAAKPGLQLTINRAYLQVLLDKAGTVIPTRDVMPVLKNFRFEATTGSSTALRVIATDMERWMIASTKTVTVTQPGIAVFPARKLLDIIRAADDSDVTITVTGTSASIAAGPTHWRLSLQSGADYPVMPEIADTVFSTVNRTEFAGALATVRYAVSRDANRANLMMIDVRGGKMTACDGSRFHQARTVAMPFDLRIPIGAVDDLIRLLKTIDHDTISVGESANHLIFKLGTDVFIVNKLVAAFPDMEAMLLRPAMENRHQLTVRRTDLIEAVKRVRINADTETSAVALILAPGQLTIAARDKFGNEASQNIDADWTRPQRTLVVNHAFLTQMITGHPGDTLTFKLGDDTATRRSALMLAAADTGNIGVVQQMLSDWT